MRSELPDLVAALERHKGTGLLALVAAFPRHAETGFREERGAAISAISNLVAALNSNATAYRIAWSQMAIVTNAADPADGAARLESVLREGQFIDVEVRAVAIEVTGQVSITVLDELLGEMSAKAKFGACYEGHTWHFVDGHPWMPP